MSTTISNNYKVLMTHHNHDNDTHIILGYDSFNESEKIENPLFNYDYYFTAYMFGCAVDNFANGHYHMDQIEAIQDYLKRINQGY